MTKSDCQEALQHFSSREFSDWHGLPEGCTITEARKILKLSDGYGTGHLGQEAKPAYFATAELDGYVNVVRAWYRDEKVVLIKGGYPSLTVDLAALLKSYGEPEAKQDYYQGVLEIKAGAWVYPQRGITLFMNVDSTLLAQVAVYPATSLRDYVAQLAPQEKQREFRE
jgi:hypothetical protein